ncbi:hypothetical protein C8J57DRAFT_1303694 [Mycena rebaudengoi]|nr:hypothetical protein C8J57DRAFT_1303694 [Mycena rebaudengoi]
MDNDEGRPSDSDSSQYGYKSRAYGKLPSSLSITGVSERDKNPAFGGRFADTPPEIWRLIATFLPFEVLINFCCVSRTFLQIVRETRYQAINFVAYDTVKPLIKHLKARDSELVHSVRVRPWMAATKTPKSYSWSSSTWKFLNPFVSADYAAEQLAAQTQRRMRKQIQRVTEAIRTLPKLHTFHIDWDEGPANFSFFSAVLQSIVPSIARSLCTLSLKVPWRYMLYLPHLHLPNLESLALTIHTGALGPSEIADQYEGLGLFIRSLLWHRLRSLSIHTTPTSTHLDLGPIFSTLVKGKANLNRLHAFTLCIPFDGGHLPDVEPLRRFLYSHCLTLDSLTLGTTRAAVHASPGGSGAKFWIQRTLENHPPIPELSRLVLGLRPLRTDLAPLFPFLSRLRPQLSVLALTERPLEYAELVRVLDALVDAPQLRALSLRIRWLTPEVVDRLAERLPALRSLGLKFAEVLHGEPPKDNISNDMYGLSMPGERMLFFQALQGRKYLGWQLTRLAIPDSPRGQLSWLDEMETAFVGCVPTLTCFEEIVSLP